MEYVMKIMNIDEDNSNMKRFVVAKPTGYKFVPGKSSMIGINKPGLEEEKKQLPIASMNSDYYLEFIFKENSKRDEFNENLRRVKAGEEFIVSDPVGTIEFSRPGVFLACDSGIVPFLSIFRQLKQFGEIAGNTLVYFARNKEDIIFERELRHMLGNNCIFVMGKENNGQFENRTPDINMLKSKITDFSQPFYVCGPYDFVVAARAALQGVASNVVSEIIE